MKFGHCAAWSFGKIPHGEKVLIDKSSSPGPANYLPTKYTFKNPPGFRMVPSSGDRGLEKKTDVPGVGNYTIPSTFGKHNTASTIPSNPKYTMKGPLRGPELTKTNCSPGPAYNPQLKRSGPAYSLGGRINTSPDNTRNPGPGNYTIRTNKSLVVPSYRFGKEEKGCLNNMGNPTNLPKWNEDPGPGNYSPNADIQHTSQPKFSFGKEPRGDHTKPIKPGPGDYDFKMKFGNEGPVSSMHGSISPNGGMNRSFETSPGPGAYLPNMYTKPSPPGFKLGTSSRDLPNNDIKNNNPGPGSYAFDKAQNNTLNASPKWGMGTGVTTRMDPRLKNREYSPGPGNYKIDKNLGMGPKFSLGPKLPPNTKWKESIPGPGNYNSGTTANLKKNPGWKIGTEARGDELKGGFKNTVPGPGMYDTRKGFVAPSTVFGKSARMEGGKKSEAGPGSYRIPCSIVDVNPYTRSAGKFDPKFKFV